METGLHDLVISGSGSASGGKYDVVEISGSGRVNGDFECLKYKVSGSAKICGHVKTEKMRISGSAHHYGDVVADTIDVSGSTHVEGHVAASELSVSGSMKIDKHLSGENIDVSGSIRIKESCAVESFKVKGSFTIEGLLNADDIDVTLYHTSEALEIGGEKIRARRCYKGLLGKLFGGFNPILTTDIIEGDEIDLEFTHAKVVRGKNVRIGAGCEIELVEYTDEYKQDNSSDVKESKKI